MVSDILNPLNWNVPIVEPSSGKPTAEFMRQWKAQRVINAAGDAVTSVNGKVGAVILDTDDVGEGVVNLYFTVERVDDRVASLLVAGPNITLVYDDTLNTLTISATGGGSGGVLPLTTGALGPVLVDDGFGQCVAVPI